MKATLFALITAVLAVTACNKADNTEAARRAETFSPSDYSSSSSPSTNRVGVDVDLDKTKNGYKVDADGYRVDDRGMRIDSPNNGKDLGTDIKNGVDSFGKRVGEGIDDIGNRAERVGDRVSNTNVGGDAVAAGHTADNGVKSDMVGDLDLGRTLNAKGDVSDRTQQFKVGDPIVASVDADNLSSAGALTATLKTKSGKVIATDKASFSAGKENAFFRLGNAPAAGDYVLTISGSNGEVESQSFSIHN